MAILNIKKAGDPVLKETCAEIDFVDGKLRKLLDDMAETMYKSDGVGLAAPQVGVPIRMVVIDVNDEHGLIEMVNPVIIRREGSEIDNEGCLSVPEIFGNVERAAKVTVEYQNRRGKRQRLTAKGLLARCIQHELDHLEGTLFIDIAKSIRKGRSDSK